jgi:hypothetical protein
LRFLPAANFAGSAPTITAHLIDDSSGSVTFQTGLNIPTVGSTTQYSNDTVVLSHTVTAVNDPPVRTAPTTLPTISVNEDSANTTAVSLGLSALAYSNGGESGQTLTYTITSIPAFVRIFKADGVSEVNQPAGRTIDLGGVSVTTTVADTNSTLGRIAWTGLTSKFSRIQVDARSKPVLTAAMADITLIVNATSSAAGTVEVQAMDMGYNLASGNWTLASPLGGINYGSVTFSETLGLSNQPFPTSSSVRNASPAQTARTLNWSGSSSFTLGASTSVSLMKSVTIAHTRGSLTTQAQAGGKLVETSAPVDMRPYLDWVLPVGAAIDTSAPASTVTAVERKSSGFETAAPAEIFKKIGSVAIASPFGIVDTDALSDRSPGEQTSEVSEFDKMTPDARLKNRLNLRGRIK